MSATTPARRGRTAKNDGPRASLKQLLPYLTEHKGVLSVVIVLSIVGAVASLVQPLLVGQVIVSVQAGDTLGSLVWVLVTLVIVAAIISGVQHYLLQRTGTGIVLSARRRLVSRMLRLPIREYDTRRTGDLVSRVGSDTTLLYAVMTQGLVDAVGGVLIFIGAIIAMLILDPVLLGLTVLVIGASIAVVGALSGRIRRASQEQQEKVGDLAASVERALSAIRTIRAAGATERENATIDGNARNAWVKGIKVANVSAFVVPIANVALQVSLLTVLGVGGFRVAAGETSIAELVMFVFFLFMLISPLGLAFGAITSVSQALGALGRIQEIIDLPSESEEDAAAVALAPIDSDDAIAFDHVHFSYPESAHKTEADKVLAEELGEGAVTHDRTVLHDVSFSVPRGQRIALVGPSGAGKSTILSLIERFYDPTGGAVRMGGRDIRSLDRAELRSRIGYVEQDAPVLAGSIRDNLTLGAPDATDAACTEVLASVNLTSVLKRDPAGLDAQVGEDGVMLSGGERQRLAIARALLAAPPILLLDESTSSLDGLNEQLLREAIDAVARDRTLIVIAHRLSTVVDSDRIVVLERGRVVGEGTHSELVASTPLYRDLAKHQLLV
ncbi:ABC transporter ATP-binding protein/permease [Salinibacterium sp. SYSU T00001]|uniref:ABC transporter ATP-binding protein n=1 Tax=Homoserinimonas sedimenticola TaxID=2986805 RepID=UPI002235CA3A|nr:ABC transporter ATP-binding protein [Salinibacterium sedimenticola]MCW4385137.1 ABC transporter ATP-binding protein/permease [Salinibacterium sedimenticola]